MTPTQLTKLDKQVTTGLTKLGIIGNKIQDAFKSDNNTNFDALMSWLGERGETPLYNNIKSIRVIPSIRQFDPKFDDCDPQEWEFKVEFVIDITKPDSDPDNYSDWCNQSSYRDGVKYIHDTYNIGVYADQTEMNFNYSSELQKKYPCARTQKCIDSV